MPKTAQGPQELRCNYRDHEKSPDFNRTQLCGLMMATGKFNLYQAALDATQLYKLAKSLAALSVANCNYGLSKRQETRGENIAKDVEMIASWYGWKATTGGDPRGYVVRLHGPGIPQNGWGDGFGVA